LIRIDAFAESEVIGKHTMQSHDLVTAHIKMALAQKAIARD
jgi:hypothetical protein